MPRRCRVIETSSVIVYGTVKSMVPQSSFWCISTTGSGLSEKPDASESIVRSALLYPLALQPGGGDHVDKEHTESPSPPSLLTRLLSFFVLRLDRFLLSGRRGLWACLHLFSHVTRASHDDGICL